MPIASIFAPGRPPTITHCSVPSSSQGVRSIRPKSGSADTNLTGAGNRASTVSLGAYFCVSTDVPIQPDGQPSGKCSSHAATKQRLDPDA